MKLYHFTKRMAVVVLIVWSSVHITTKVESSNPAHARCTWYSIIW